MLTKQVHPCKTEHRGLYETWRCLANRGAVPGDEIPSLGKESKGVDTDLGKLGFAVPGASAFVSNKHREGRGFSFFNTPELSGHSSSSANEACCRAETNTCEIFTRNPPVRFPIDTADTRS